MKFVFAVVMLALVFGAQSSIVPLSYTAVHGPTVYAAAAPSVYYASSPYHTVLASAPAAVAYHAAPAVVHAPVVLAQAEGTYVAQTRGAVHVAPLPGHANSASSVNLEAAPGTL